MSTKKRPRWTPDQDTRLKLLWNTPIGITELAKKFDRSNWAVCRRAKALGLQQSVPPEYEFTTDASKRTGFELKSLKKILDWASVVPQPVRTYGNHKKTSKNEIRKTFRKTFVDPFDVDEAIEKWLLTETPAFAAKRAGVDPKTIQRWLIKAGFEPPKSRHHWRVETEFMNKIIAQHCSNLT